MRIFLLLLALIPLINGYKVLYLVPFPAPSHWMWLKHFSEEMLTRGHHVTVITNSRRPEPHENYTEIIIDPPYNVVRDFPISDFYGMKFDSVLNNLYLTWDIGLYSTEHALNDKNVGKFINSTNHQFDVIVLEQFFHDSWLMFAHKFKAPIVTIATLGHADYFDHAMGLMTPWSFVPHSVLTFNDNMSFVQRCTNIFWGLTDAFLRRFYYMSQMQEMAEKYFANLEKPLPSVIELEKNISHRIVNNHHSMMKPRPKMPGLTYIAGIHIKPPKKLPADLQQFLDDAEDGVIYFSFGSCIRSADLPVERLNAFLETFRTLKQKVLWKFENETLPNLPSNVLIRKWLPQSDILAHKNVKLFLTHGGAFGTQEGVHHGVPMLFIPVYSDQFRNAMRCVDAGYAEMLRFTEVTRDALVDKINQMWNVKRYELRAKEISSLFRDNLVDPMDEAMFWIEYTARHKGTEKVFKSHAADLPWYIYLHLDIVFVVLVIYWLLKRTVKFIVNLLFRSEDDKQTQKCVKLKST